MPRGIYPHPPQCGFQKGYIPSKEHLKKMSKTWFKKGHKIKAPVLFGSKARNWKGGLPKCVDCGQQFKYYASNRCFKCHRKYNKGENHYNWQGGISNLPYSFEFNKDLKEKIRKRDNYQCQNKECNMTEEEHLIVFGESILIHHIDYNKKNCKENNLISLCRQCNSRVNFNRSYWENRFIKLVKRRKE